MNQEAIVFGFLLCVDGQSASIPAAAVELAVMAVEQGVFELDHLGTGAVADADILGAESEQAALQFQNVGGP